MTSIEKCMYRKLKWSLSTYIIVLTFFIYCFGWCAICSNIEDICRDAGSVDVEEDILLRKHRLAFLHAFY